MIIDRLVALGRLHREAEEEGAAAVVVVVVVARGLVDLQGTSKEKRG
jgi:uncharacterized protein YbjQ (UPF0145 family)